MKTKATLCAVMLGASGLKAAVVDEKLVAAIAWAETRNRDVKGAAGEVGTIQMRQCAVWQGERWMAHQQHRPVNSRAWMWFLEGTEDIRAHYAIAYLDWLNLQYWIRHGDNPTTAQLVMLWNAPELAEARKFNLNNMPAATKRLVREVEARMKP
jgi:hypothetical protein